MVLAQGRQPLVFLEKCSQCGSLRKKGKAGRVSLLGLEALRRPLRRVEFSECMSCPPAGCFSPKGTWVLQLFVHQIEDGRGREQQDHTLHIIHHLPFSSCYISNLCQKKKKNKQERLAAILLSELPLVSQCTFVSGVSLFSALHYGHCSHQLAPKLEIRFLFSQDYICIWFNLSPLPGPPGWCFLLQPLYTGLGTMGWPGGAVCVCLHMGGWARFAACLGNSRHSLQFPVLSGLGCGDREIPGRGG